MECPNCGSNIILLERDYGVLKNNKRNIISRCDHCGYVGNGLDFEKITELKIVCKWLEGEISRLTIDEFEEEPPANIIDTY